MGHEAKPLEMRVCEGDFRGVGTDRPNSIRPVAHFGIQDARNDTRRRSPGRFR
jgi:hypothetical protein